MSRDSRTGPTKGVLLGGLAGGLTGGLVRGAVTLFNLREGAELGVLASLPSAGIGFLCGAVAGGFCRPGRGAAVGAVLSAGVFGLFVLPVAYLAALFDAAGEVAGFTWPYFLQKAAAGAVAGGLGGFVGRRVLASERETRATALGGDEAA